MAEMESSPRCQLKPVDQEAQPKGDAKQGGWITLPFIAGSMLAMGLAINGTSTNLQIYLIKEYNVESIDATQIASILRGSLNLVPLAGAILSDSYFGCFPVILAGAAINVLSFVLFTLSAALPSLRPPHCPTPSAACQHGTPGQLAVLYAAMFLLAIGTGGTRFNMATLGADQFSSSRDQDTFFNWYFVSLYVSFLLGDTAIVYLQDGVSWGLGFGVCLAATVFSLAMLLMGVRYYRMPAPKGSPYWELARVVVAAVRKGRIDVGRAQYHVGDDAVADSASEGAPSKRLRFLNRAAMITPSDNSMETSGVRRTSHWRLCRVQQVEDLKSLLAVFPLWSSGVILSVSIGVMIGMIILQALTMDRSIGHGFKIPAGSVSVCSLTAFIVVTPVLDRAVFPLWRRITDMPPSALQRVGQGHVVNIANMVVAALVERRKAERSARAPWRQRGGCRVGHPHVRVVAGLSSCYPRHRGGPPLPRKHGLLLSGVPQGVEELGDGHGAAAHRHGVLPQHGVRRRREACHGVAAGEHKSGEAGQRVLDPGCGGGLFSTLCQPIQV